MLTTESYNPDVLTCLANLSSDEVFTPPTLANQMLDLLIESRRVLGGVTGHTTGKLTSQHGLAYKEIIRAFGKDVAKQYAGANEWALTDVRTLSQELSIDCDLATETANVFAFTNQGRESLQEELDAAKQVGLPASLETENLPAGATSALRFDNQFRFHPVRFLVALLEQSNAEVFEQSRVTKVEERDGRCVVETDQAQVVAKDVVIATHYPIHDSGLFVARLAPYRSYALAVEAPDPPPGMYISTGEPVRSFRPQEYDGRKILIVAGANHKVGQEDHTEESYRELEEFARTQLGATNVLCRWSTQDNWTPDKLPYVGRSPNRDHIYVATGFGGWGMSNGIAASRILAELLHGREHPWPDAYNPSRGGLKGAAELIKENINAAKHLVGDRLSAADLEDFSELRAGQAGIVQLKNERVAAYRDEAGDLHVITSACTHMGCQVAWNPAEKSWDCPCHGSRFAPDGSVLQSPAVEPLEKREP